MCSDILISKLQHYGVRDEALHIFESYLNNRRFYVEISNIVNRCELATKSRLVNITRGIPQGSILGPILFIIFINDLIKYICDTVPGLQVIVYADDTNAIISEKNVNDLESKVNFALKSFNNWFCANNLKLNTNKTQVILFKSTTHNKQSMNIVLNGDGISMVHCVQFLGVNINQFLNWKDELASIENYISSACYALRSLRDELNIKQLKMVYFSLVESKLRYSIRCWGRSYDYNIKRAFILQKRVIRTMVGIPPWESCREKFRELQILTVPSLYVMALLIDIIKCRDKYETAEQKAIRLKTRRKDIIIDFFPKLNIAKHCSRYQAVKIFNSLPINLKCIDSLSIFQQKLRNLLLEGCFYTVNDFIDKNANV